MQAIDVAAPSELNLGELIQQTTLSTTKRARSGTATSTVSRRSSRAAAAWRTLSRRCDSCETKESARPPRGGGHAVAGHAFVDDGVVIDVSPMRGSRIDPVSRTIRLEGGCLNEHLDRDAGVRASCDGRLHQSHGYSQPHAGRRNRPSDARLWADHR